MKFKFIIGIALIILALTISCNRDEITFDTASKELRVSSDTIFCDTIYHQMRSETYAVKIYNQEDKDIEIPKIELEQGFKSQFRINVDGAAGTNFSNIPLRKKDSLYIFIEVAPIANAKEAIAEDHIILKTNIGTQKVALLSVVQDAQYFIQSKNNTNTIDENTTWTNEKAKIIFGNISLADGKTLTIEKGTKVYFHKNSGMKIGKGSILNVKGDLGEEVIFRGDRNETKYDTIPGNWNGIQLAENAELKMNYAKVFGGNTGVSLNNSKAQISNTMLHTFMDYGLYAVSSEVTAQNLVVHNAGQSSIGIIGGGKYNFIHSTIINYWNLNSTAPAYSLYASNSGEGAGSSKALDLTLSNSIVYAMQPDALILKINPPTSFNYYFQNCLIKHTNDSNAGFGIGNNPKIVNTIINKDPLFINYYTQKLNLHLKPDSPARAYGNLNIAALVPLDLAKISRTVNPSLGAFQ